MPLGHNLPHTKATEEGVVSLHLIARQYQARAGSL